MKPNSAMISKILTRALQLWLRSQVEEVHNLKIEITGRDHQLLRGYLPLISIATEACLYQGLRLGETQLQAQNIRINLGQVIKGQPLHLLEPVPVQGQVNLTQADLQASVSSPLLVSALNDLFAQLLKAGGYDENSRENNTLNWDSIQLEADKIVFQGSLTNVQGQIQPVSIRTGLDLVSPQQLRLYPLHVSLGENELALNLNQFDLNLGSETEIRELHLRPGELFCKGGLTVKP